MNCKHFLPSKIAVGGKDWCTYFTMENPKCADCKVPMKEAGMAAMYGQGIGADSAYGRGLTAFQEQAIDRTQRDTKTAIMIQVAAAEEQIERVRKLLRESDIEAKVTVLHDEVTVSGDYSGIEARMLAVLNKGIWPEVKDTKKPGLLSRIFRKKKIPKFTSSQMFDEINEGNCPECDKHAQMFVKERTNERYEQVQCSICHTQFLLDNNKQIALKIYK